MRSLYGRFLQKSALYLRICGSVWLTLGLLNCGYHQNQSFGRTRVDNVIEGLKPVSTPDMLLNSIDVGDLSAALEHLQTGLDINQLLPNGRTALIHATVQNRAAFVKAFLDRGAEVHLPDDQGQTALDYAKKNGALKIWLLLDPDKMQAEQVVLFQAVSRKRVLLVQEQLNAGVDANFIDEASGETPLTQSVRVRSVPVAQILISWRDPEQVTDLNLQLTNNQGQNALEVAREMQFAPLINLLEGYYANPP